MIARRRCQLVAVATAALSAVGAASAMPGSSPAANRAAARRDAGKLLRTLRLPAGAQRSLKEPNGGGPSLARPVGAPDTPNLIDRHAWWRVPASPQSVLAYIASHSPAGSKLAFNGSGSGPRGLEFAAVGYSWPAVSGVLGTRQLAITAVPLQGGHKSAVRVDAEDVWITPRPASERIPASSASLRLEVRRGGSVRQGPIELTSAPTLERVITLLNSLPLAQPGVYACPADPGIRVGLRFFAAKTSSTPDAVAVVNPFGCGGVQLTLGGRREPALASGPIPGEPPSTTLAQLLQHDLGVKLRISATGR